MLISLLALVASAVGTLTGFGTSTIMVPVVASFYPLPQTLLLVGIVHWFGNIWKLALFREGIRWKLILQFGIPGVAATIVGGLVAFKYEEVLLTKILGATLLGYVVFLLVKSRIRLPRKAETAIAGGTLYGFSAGISGIGGPVRGAFLAAFDLPKSVYIATTGAIGLAIDTGRLSTYWWQGASLDERLLWGLLLFVPASYIGAKTAERLVDRIPQDRFRIVLAACLGAIALKFLFT